MLLALEKILIGTALGSGLVKLAGLLQDFIGKPTLQSGLLVAVACLFHFHAAQEFGK